MPIKICPRCNERYVIDMFTTDFEHRCNSGIKALDEEDILVIGDWEDFTGSQTVDDNWTKVAGTQNLLQGTRAGLEGEDLEDMSVRGKSKAVHRQRQHFQFIKNIKC